MDSANSFSSRFYLNFNYIIFSSLNLNTLSMTRYFRKLKPISLLIILGSLLSGIGAAAQEGKSTYETAAYSIEFPAKPQESSKPIPSSIGELTLHIMAYEPEPNAKDLNYVYMIMESNYPDSLIKSGNAEMLDKFYRGAIDGTIRDIKGTLLKETKIQIGSYPARTIEIDFNNGLAIIKMTMILRENKFIIIQTITDPKKYPNTTSDNFFNSFAIK